MKVYSAKYDPAYNTADNSLVNNMLKYPEIAKKIIELYPRYSMTYLLERLGFGASEKVIGGHSFEWKVMQRYKAPAKLDEDLATNFVAGTDYTIKISSDSSGTNEEYCMLNANDVVRFASGATALVVSVGAIDATSGGFTEVVVKAIDADTADKSAGDVVAVIGSAFGQGSLGDEVGEGYAYPETHRNHLTLSRRKCKINGIDLHDVTWVEHNGHRLWYFTKEQQMTDQFMYELELNRWFGKSSVLGDTGSNAISFPGDQGSAVSGLPIIGDGILAQIATANQLSTAGVGITEGELLKFIGHLSLNSLKATGNEYVVFTGMQGMIQFQQAMQAHLATMGAASSLIASKSGEGVAVGSNFTSYSALGNNIKLVHNPCFDDPNVAAMSSTGANSTIGGFNTAALSGLMVFMDMSVQDGVGNVELIAKGAEGYNRNYVKKYVPGMINPNDPSSMMAANGNDTFECHILSESGVIVRNPQSCGVIKPAGLTI